MSLFRVLKPSILEAVAKKSLSSLSAASPSTLKSTVYWEKNSALPLAAQQRCQHTVNTLAKDQMSSIEKVKWDLGFYGKLRVPKRKLHMAGFRLYICCTDFIDFGEFVKELHLPDTFNAWFLLLQVHLWLLHVKFSQMGKEGLLLTQHLYRNMWSDVERRLNTFQELLGSEKAASMRQFHSLMCSSILYYDEGLIGDDARLANALWLQLFSMDQNVDPRDLELMVEYIRKQVHYLDNMKDDPILHPGYVSFLPLHGTEVDADKIERDIQILQNMKI